MLIASRDRDGDFYGVIKRFSKTKNVNIPFLVHMCVLNVCALTKQKTYYCWSIYQYVLSRSTVNLSKNSCAFYLYDFVLLLTKFLWRIEVLILRINNRFIVERRITNKQKLQLLKFVNKLSKMSKSGNTKKNVCSFLFFSTEKKT